jgi:bifunctional non-homologous end joining protein LigD
MDKIVDSLARAGLRRRRPSRSAEGSRTKHEGLDQAGPVDASRLSNARRRSQPKSLSPQLATLVTDPPRGDEWLHELKYDGYRLLCMIEDGKPRLLTRRGIDWTYRFPHVASAARRLPIKDGIVDGEVVAIGPDGAPNFQLLQNALSGGRQNRLIFYAFDLPHCGGYELYRTPLVERKSLLQELLDGADSQDVIRMSSHIVGSGAEVFRQACRRGLEGVVSKRIDSSYVLGRSRTWLKVKCRRAQEFVVGGWTDPQGTRQGFGALLVGWYQADGSFIYAGRVGTGFDQTSLLDLKRRLDQIPASHVPFQSEPRGRNSRRAHWVDPKLVVEVEYAEMTQDGILRQASFRGLREDKSPREVVRELPVRPAGARSPRAAGN